MKLKSVFAWLATVVVGLSLGQAHAGTVVVDDFNNLTTPPGGNQWSQAGAPAMGGARDFTKIGGTWGPNSPQDGRLRYTASGQTLPGSSRLELRYDGNAAGTGQFNPLVNLTTAPGGGPDLTTAKTWLSVKGTFLTTSATTALASISWKNSTGGLNESTLTSTVTHGCGGAYLFKISNLTPGIPNLTQIARIYVRFDGLAAGDSYIDKIFFTDLCVPEPSTFALAGLAAVGLVIVRRKKS
jgi:hypothetical protein